MKFSSNLEKVIDEASNSGKIPLYIITTPGSSGKEKFDTVDFGKNLFKYNCILIHPDFIGTCLSPWSFEYTCGDFQTVLLSKQEILNPKYLPLNVSISKSGNMSVTHRNDAFLVRYLSIFHRSPYLHTVYSRIPFNDDESGKIVPVHPDLSVPYYDMNLIAETREEISLRMSAPNDRKDALDVFVDKERDEHICFSIWKRPRDIKKYVIPFRAFLYYIGLSYGIDESVYNQVDETILANLPDLVNIYDLPSMIEQMKQ